MCEKTPNFLRTARKSALSLLSRRTLYILLTALTYMSTNIKMKSKNQILREQLTTTQQHAPVQQTCVLQGDCIKDNGVLTMFYHQSVQTYNIHSSIHHQLLIWSWIAGVAVHCHSIHSHCPFTLIVTPTDNLDSLVELTACLMMGENQSTWRKPTHQQHTLGIHTWENISWTCHQSISGHTFTHLLSLSPHQP